MTAVSIQLEEIVGLKEYCHFETTPLNEFPAAIRISLPTQALLAEATNGPVIGLSNTITSVVSLVVAQALLLIDHTNL